MRRWIRSVAGVIALALISGLASAHHSTAMYDLARSVKLEGVVKSFQWGNPHNYVQLIATGDAGAQVEWSLECGTPVTATLMGWSKDSFKPGDRVSVVIAPSKDGSPNGTVKTATLANGTTLSSVAADAKAASPFDSIPSLKRVPTK
jgi:hypothetical protein